METEGGEQEILLEGEPINISSGSVDDVLVNGESVVRNRIARVIVPTKTSELDNDDGFITNTVNDLVNYYTKTSTDALLANKADKSELPTKTSQLTNDSGFITNAVNNLVNYYLKSETYTQLEVNYLIGQIQTAHFEIVEELPVTGEDNIIYLVLRTTAEEYNIYDEYIWVGNTYEKIGSTDVDLTGYATEDWVNLQIADFLTSAEVTNLINTALADYYTKTQIDSQIDQIEEEQEAQDIEIDYYKTIYNALPKLTGTGTDVTIDGAADTILRLLLKGNLSQDGTPTVADPIDIDVVTGNNQIIVQNKNLLNLPSTYSIRGNQLYNLSLKSGVYTFSWSNWVSSGANSQFSIDFIFTDDTLQNLYFYPALQSYRNVTLEKDLKQIRIYSNTTEGNSRAITATFTNFMMEHGTYTSGFSYVPHRETIYPINIGSIEMCNIPNQAYSDYFREINGIWYKHAEVGKIASYDGETITTPYISTTGGLDTGATVYYGLETPIDEEISDTTLTGQLNALKYALAYQGQTNISQANDEQPFIIVYETIEFMGGGGLLDALLSGETTEVYSEITTLRDSAFASNKYITSIELPNVDNSPYRPFNSCAELRTLKIPKMKQISNNNYGVAYCGNLREVDCSSLEAVGAYDFAISWNGQANYLTEIRLPKIKSIGSGAFQYRTALVAIILGEGTRATLANASNDTIPANTIIYAYQDDIDNWYSTATNWVTLYDAGRILPIEGSIYE